MAFLENTGPGEGFVGHLWLQWLPVEKVLGCSVVDTVAILCGPAESLPWGSFPHVKDKNSPTLPFSLFPQCFSLLSIPFQLFLVLKI